MTAVRSGVAISHRDQLPSSSRYELLVKIASGGMATVYVGRNTSVGISRLVAVKRAHAHLLEDPAFARMLIEEAKLASRIHHPNVVAVQNVEEMEGELLLVMDYVEGASLSDLIEIDDPALPAKVAVRVILDACAGLHAAHELTDDDGKPLGLVHRDVSPHNILVGVDGIGRLTDFGIAKSSGHTASAGKTSTGALKGKVAYMAPEYVDSGTIDARSDVFSLGIVTWEMLTRGRLFRGTTEVESLKMVLAAKVPRPSKIVRELGGALDDVVLKALARSPKDRYASAAELGEALEVAARKHDLIAKHAEVAAYVKSVAGAALAYRRELVREKSGVKQTDVSEREDTTDRMDVIKVRDTNTAPFVDGVTAALPTDLAARLVDESRPSVAPPRPRRGAWAAVALGLGAIATTAYVFTSRTPPPAAATERPPAPAPVPAPSARAIVVEPAPSPVAPPATSAPPPPKPVAVRPPPLQARPPAAPRPPLAATTFDSKPPPPPPPPAETGDKAPPNPYGR